MENKHTNQKDADLLYYLTILILLAIIIILSPVGSSVGHWVQNHLFVNHTNAGRQQSAISEVGETSENKTTQLEIKKAELAILQNQTEELDKIYKRQQEILTEYKTLSLLPDSPDKEKRVLDLARENAALVKRAKEIQNENPKLQ